MGVSIPIVTRQGIALLIQEGVSKTEISKRMDIPYRSVLKISKRYEEKGQSGLILFTIIAVATKRIRPIVLNG